MQSPGTLARWAMRLLTAAAAAMALMLLIESLDGQGEMPGCGPGGACAALLASEWAKILGIPVAALAVVTDAILFGALMHIGPTTPERRRRIAWWIAGILSVASLLVIGWFVKVMHQDLGQYCILCLIHHGLLGLAAILVVWHVRLRPISRLLAMIAGLLLGSSLIAAQVLAPTLTTRDLGGAADFDTGPMPGRRLSIGGYRVHLSTDDVPTVGSKQSDDVLVLFHDYTCAHCRVLHDQLTVARRALPEPILLIVLPTPMDARCNPMLTQTLPGRENACEYARLALAVWRADEEKFAEFDAYLSKGERPPSVTVARGKAAALVGEDALRTSYRDAAVDEQITNYLAAHRLLGASNLPVLAHRGSLLQGRPRSAELLVKLLRDRWGVGVPGDENPVQSDVTLPSPDPAAR